MANTSTSSVTSLTDAQLTGIYNCTITDWHAIDAAIPAGTTIKPLVPWINAEIRLFWGRQVGITATLPACVKDVYNGSTIAEFGTAAVAGTPNSNPATTTAGDLIKASGFLEQPLGQCGRV